MSQCQELGIHWTRNVPDFTWNVTRIFVGNKILLQCDAVNDLKNISIYLLSFLSGKTIG